MGLLVDYSGKLDRRSLGDYSGILGTSEGSLRDYQANFVGLPGLLRDNSGTIWDYRYL